MSLLWITFLCVCVTFILNIFRKHLLRAAIINKMPGPKGYPIFGITLTMLTNRENIMKTGNSLTRPFAEKFPLMSCWFGPFPAVFILKAEAAKVIFNSNKQIDKAMFYNYLHSWLGLGLLTSTGTKWQQRRKIITPTFHFRILENFLQVMNEQADILIQVLEKKCKEINNEVFDIYPFIARCSLDIICETAMGQGVKAQSNSDSEYVNAVNNLGDILTTRMLRPWLAPEFIFKMSKWGKLEKKALEIVHGFTNKIIKIKRMKVQEKKSNINAKDKSENEDEALGLKRRVALLDMLIEASEENKLTDEDIREEVDTFMFEGHDTTAVGVGWTLYCIGQYPDVQNRLLEEQNQVFGDSNGEITSDDLHKLKYLECVIKESLRLFPPVPLYGRTINEDINICGYDVPRGVMVIVSPYFIHRDESVYPDAERFDPTRFFPENSVNRDPFAFVPFAAGARNCIGQKFAVMEMKVIVSRILRNFHLKTRLFEDLEANQANELVLRPTRGINIKLSKRK